MLPGSRRRAYRTVQGAAYGMSPYVRVSYATDEASLREGCARIQAFCRSLTTAH